MALFKNQSGKLRRLKEERFKLEKDLQVLTENNIEEIFGLKFVSTEFALDNLRIDTLAFDEEAKAFIIIEYKRDKSFSVVDQGFSYLSLMLNNKAEFILEFNERMNKNLGRDDVDWSQSRVVFVAHSYTVHQRNSINFKDLPIELWEARKYETGDVLFNQVKASNARESIKAIQGGEGTEKVKREIKTYNYTDYFRNSGWDKSLELADRLTERLSERYEVEFKFTKSHISVQPIENKNLITIKPQKNRLEIGLLRTKASEFDDPKNRVTDLENSFKYYNQYISRFYVESEEDVEYAMFLIEQVYKKHWS